jgi:hypothetical protein
MSAAKAIAVVGATGRQGNVVARTILADPAAVFTVRALTRNTDSLHARQLAALGADVVEADPNDEESMRRAYDGAYGAYVVHDSLTSGSTGPPGARLPQESAWAEADMELAQAAIAARAARDAGLRHVIWATPQHTRAHFDPVAGSGVPRGERAHYLFTELGVPTTFLQTTYHSEGMRGGMLARDPSGEVILGLTPVDSGSALTGVEDTGRTALIIFRSPDEYIGRTVRVAEARADGEELAATLSEALGETVHYRPFAWGQLCALPLWARLAAAKAFQYFTEPQKNLPALHDLDGTRRIDPRTEMLDAWVRPRRASPVLLAKTHDRNGSGRTAGPEAGAAGRGQL